VVRLHPKLANEQIDKMKADRSAKWQRIYMLLSTANSIKITVLLLLFTFFSVYTMELAVAM
jgi:hypothetical protein